VPHSGRRFATTKSNDPNSGHLQDLDLTRAVYDYIHTLGNVGDEVRTAILPYLMRNFDLTDAVAARARRTAMRELTERGSIKRLNTRGPYVRILN
jgi:hypothetical protein